jgi:hypothetical protein
VGFLLPAPRSHNKLSYGLLDFWMSGFLGTPIATPINPTTHQSIHPTKSYEQDKRIHRKETRHVRRQSGAAHETRRPAAR